MSTTARDVADQVTGMVNIFGNNDNIDEFVDQIVNRTHRTLQQGVMRLFMRIMEEQAKKFNKGDYDLRNEATCRMCEKIVEATKDMCLPLV